VDRSTWEVPRFFRELQNMGDVSDDEMDWVFNMGLGMVLAVPVHDADAVVATLASHDRPARVIGELTVGSGQVRMDGTRQGDAGS
jgi:phosphoribosylformylglycinamidine cyclo-ligase